MKKSLSKKLTLSRTTLATLSGGLRVEPPGTGRCQSVAFSCPMSGCCVASQTTNMCDTPGCQIS